MKKILIAWMLLLVMVFAVACGTDKKKGDGILPDPTADVIPENSVVPDQNNNNGQDNDGTMPENGTVDPDGNGAADNGTMPDGNGTGQNDGADSDTTVIPELVPSEGPSASPDGGQTQK